MSADKIPLKDLDQDLRGMFVGEGINLSAYEGHGYGQSVMRVPGGWIFEYWRQTGNTIRTVDAAVFVPFNRGES